MSESAIRTLNQPKMKKEVKDLAIFGGAPSFSERLHVGRPNIGNKTRLLERINCVLDSGWLTNDGPYVKEFERRIADLVGAKHCVAMCNATTALEIVIRASDFTGEVILPSFTVIHLHCRRTRFTMAEHHSGILWYRSGNSLH
ncbi:MAG: DegT/DnrJ/EryC1/StrS family aminotransferase [Pyrinomonadaceae bacterium]